MQSTGEDSSKIIEINGRHRIYSVSFAEDGKQVLTGGVEGFLRRWRVDDGHEVGEAIQVEGAKIYAAALSPDRKWLVCGLRPLDRNDGRAAVRVWDAQTRKKVRDIKGHTDSVFSVDISPDSTKFATSAADKVVFIWDMVTGERLAGPLRHDGGVVAVRFSPNGDRIATVTAERPYAKSIRIFNSNDGQQLLDIPFRFKDHCLSSPLAWSAESPQLFAVSYAEVKCFDTFSGSLLSKWSVPGGEWPGSVALSQNQKFIVVIARQSLSFWDASTHVQLGTVIEHASPVWAIALSPNDDCIATGEHNGKITFRSLRDVLPSSYFTVNASDQLGNVIDSNESLPTPSASSNAFQLPLMYISDAVFESWTQGDLAHVEELLTEETLHLSNPFHHARALAHRALVRTRLKQWDMAIDDAKESIKLQRSLIGHIANAMACVRNGEHELAIRVFDPVFSEDHPTENKFLLLIKAIVMFECGKHNDAISRVDDLIDMVDDQSLYITVRAQLFLLLGGISLREGDNKRAMDLLMRAREAIPFQKSPHLVVISLIFGWDFDGLALAIQLQLQECSKPFEDDGDAAVQSKNPKEAIVLYSIALSLNPSNPASLLVRRSKAQVILGSREDALDDADGAIKADPMSPWGYERRHAALHCLQRYGEAVDAFACMLSLIEEPLDQDTRQLGRKYVSPAQSEKTIDAIVCGIFKICPLVLIDVESGRLCDGPERMNTFKSEPQFKELVSSMTQKLDDGRILRVVAKYFQYVTFSHVWQGKEPSFQDVSSVKSVWDLDSSQLNAKLRKFCEVVRTDGYRWAWSDTCCIDKTISTVLNQSLTMMYKWYEASAATLVLLASVASPSALGDLTDSFWMTRAWTAQELLAPKVIRFYDSNWKPYLGDERANHKESPEIMQELAKAIGVARETITAFNPDDLTVQEKLRLASTRNATVEEDVAYSLIGIFRSDIRPHYGEGDAALGHLLEEVVARSGDVTVLAWSGRSSTYNSCLPVTLSVYSRTPSTLSTIEDDEMESRVAALKTSRSEEETMLIYNRITKLPPARFANRRLHLPCVMFAIKRLGVQGFGSGQENRYRARVSGIGHVEFETSDRLSLTEPRKLILVHPWIRDLRGPLDGFTWGSASDGDESESDPESEAGSLLASPLHALPASTMDVYTRALHLVVRLQQSFHALLFQQQSNGEFRRVAAAHEIIVPGLESQINFARDVHVGVVEIL